MPLLFVPNQRILEFNVLVEEAGLFVGNAQLAVDGGDDALDLAHGEHASEQGVAGIMAVTRLVHDATRLIGKGHTVVDAHRQVGILFLEDTAEFDDVGTSTQMAGLGKVAIGENVTRAEVYEMGARGKLLGHLNQCRGYRNRTERH